MADIGMALVFRTLGQTSAAVSGRNRGTSGFDISDMDGIATALPDDQRFLAAAYPTHKTRVIQTALIGLVAIGTVGTASTAVWLKPPTMRTQGEGLESSARLVGLHGNERAAVQHKYLLSRIDTFMRRDFNWDGDDGVPPIKATAREAEKFLDHIMGELPLPHEVYSPGDGEIAFQWRGRDQGSFIEVAFEGGSIISWYAKVGKAAPQDDEQQYRVGSISLDDRLVRAISSIA